MGRLISVIIPTVIAVSAALGISFGVEFPADKAVADLEIQVAQNQQEQNDYHRWRELEAVEWEIDRKWEQIEDLDTIPEELDRPLTERENRRLKQLEQDYDRLQNRKEQLFR